MDFRSLLNALQFCENVHLILVKKGQHVLFIPEEIDDTIKGKHPCPIERDSVGRRTSTAATSSSLPFPT